MWRSSLALAYVAAAWTVAFADARPGTNELVRIVTPVHKQAAPAHPFVNVIVRFGQADDGTPADPSTFGVRLGREDVTDRFMPISENGEIIGMQGVLDGPALH